MIKSIVMAMAAIAGMNKSMVLKASEPPATTISLDMPQLIPAHSNADRKKAFGMFLATERGRAWRLKHRRRKANA